MINIFDTLRFNIRAFGIAKGLRLPVIIYGRIKMGSIGTIRIKCPVRRGLIVIGVNHDTVAAPCSVFSNTGTIDVYGKVYVNFGTVLLNSGTITFRGSDLIGKQCTIDIHHRLDVGHNVSFGYEDHITDSDEHYVVDVSTRQVHRSCKAVSIGNYNWFGSNCFIKKGTVTPDYLIVASPCSMLSKDYSQLPPHTVLAGCPAHPVKEGIRRVYNFQNEARIRKFFQQNPGKDYFLVDDHYDLDDFCKHL